MTTTAPPQAHAMGLEEAIREYVRIDARYSELSEEKKRALEILIPAAREVKGLTKTTRLNTVDQKTALKVVFDEEKKFDQSVVGTVRDLIGDDVFEKLFKVEYRPIMTELKTWLATASPDETLITAKQIVRQAITSVPKWPQITIERGRVG